MFLHYKGSMVDLAGEYGVRPRASVPKESGDVMDGARAVYRSSTSPPTGSDNSRCKLLHTMQKRTSLME